MTDIEILAHEVLTMRALQVDYDKMSNAKRYGVYRKVDSEEMAKTYSLMRDAEHRVQEMCKDVLGIEEE